MSITPLLHASILAPAREQAALLAQLQTLGCMDVIGYDGAASIEVDARLHAALDFLNASPRQHHRVRQSAELDLAALIARTETLRQRARALDDEREALLRRIGDVAPWGHFRLPDISDHPELRFWFYRVAPAALGRLAESGHLWTIVNRTAAECFVVVLAADEPSDLPFARVHVGSRSLAHLEDRLAEVEVEIDDVVAERASLTRWTDLFIRHLDHLRDDAAREHAAGAIERRDAVIVLTGWVPLEKAGALSEWAERAGVALSLRSPMPDESPPTLLSPPRFAAGGALLVRFFTTPGYATWDPSAVVLGSFVIFFAMIVADAVYGAILCLAVPMLWNAMERSPALRQLRLLSVLLAVSTTIWGVAIGSYAGLPPPLPILAALQILPANDQQLLLRLSLGAGLVHLILANALAAWRLRGSSTAWARVGWIGIFGAVPLWFLLPAAAYACAAIGLALVLLFTSAKRQPGARLAEGVLALPGVVSALGDTLSYMRLFALGIATTSLAVAFNALAKSALGVPGVGVVIGLMILIVGHGLNLALGIASGIIHGLRLNYIEFFRWALWDEGRSFQPFERCEQSR